MYLSVKEQGRGLIEKENNSVVSRRHGSDVVWSHRERGGVGKGCAMV